MSAGSRQIAIYTAWEGTRELLDALYETISAQFRAKYGPMVDAFITKVEAVDLQAVDVLYIIICPAAFLNRPLPKRFIAYQLEYHYFVGRDPSYIDLLRKAVACWDYSWVMIEFYRSHGIQETHVPIGYAPSLTSPNCPSDYIDTGRDIDVLFLGITIGRRQVLNEFLLAQGLTAVFISGLPNVATIHSLILRAKVCLNIHVVSQFILQTVRLSLLLANRSCIVSEPSLDTEVMDLYRHGGVTFIPSSEINRGADFLVTLRHLLANFPLRQRLANESYLWYTTQRRLPDIVDFTKLLPAPPGI